MKSNEPEGLKLTWFPSLAVRAFRCTGMPFSGRGACTTKPPPHPQPPPPPEVGEGADEINECGSMIKTSSGRINNELETTIESPVDTILAIVRAKVLRLADD